MNRDAAALTVIAVPSLETRSPFFTKPAMNPRPETSKTTLAGENTMVPNVGRI
jgi:hypothetical protein